MQEESGLWLKTTDYCVYNDSFRVESLWIYPSGANAIVASLSLDNATGKPTDLEYITCSQSKLNKDTSFDIPYY
jgi:hypothetical protein